MDNGVTYADNSTLDKTVTLLIAPLIPVIQDAVNSSVKDKDNKINKDDAYILYDV